MLFTNKINKPPTPTGKVSMENIATQFLFLNLFIN